jgi:hypothetical protein
MIRILNKEEEYVFKHPFRCYIAGPSCCGKTELLQKILINLSTLIDKPIEKITFCYSVWQNKYEILKYLNIPIEFHLGLIKATEFDSSINNLLILDDLMQECKDSIEIYNLFSVDSHHRNISVFLVSQNIYTKGKCTRDLNLNSSYMILFKNLRDVTQINNLSRQMFPKRSKEFMQVFEDATSAENGYGYLLLDLNPNTMSDMRIQGNFIEEKEKPRIIYKLD